MRHTESPTARITLRRTFHLTLPFLSSSNFSLLLPPLCCYFRHEEDCVPRSLSDTIVSADKTKKKSCTTALGFAVTILSREECSLLSLLSTRRELFQPPLQQGRKLSLYPRHFFMNASCDRTDISHKRKGEIR